MLENKGVENGVKEGGMKSEGGGVVGESLGQDDLGEELVVALEDGAQALEFGSVSEACVAELRIESVEGHGRGARRRPGAEIEGAWLLGSGRSEDAGSGPGPCAVVEAVEASVNGERASAVVVRRGDGELDADGRREVERRFDGELVDALEADVVSGSEG